jgi:predicted LPLAT superfamily acyltransferase
MNTVWASANDLGLTSHIGLMALVVCTLPRVISAVTYTFVVLVALLHPSTARRRAAARLLRDTDLRRPGSRGPESKHKPRKTA